MAMWARLRPWRDLEVFFFGTGIGQLPSSSFVFRAASARQGLSLWAWQPHWPSFRLAPQFGHRPAQSGRQSGFQARRRAEGHQQAAVGPQEGGIALHIVDSGVVVQQEAPLAKLQRELRADRLTQLLRNAESHGDKGPRTELAWGWN